MKKKAEVIFATGMKNKKNTFDIGFRNDATVSLK